MAEIVSLELTVGTNGPDAKSADASIESLRLVLENAGETVTDPSRIIRLRSAIQTLLDGGDLVNCETLDGAARLTNEFRLRLVPSELYLNMVSAIQLDTGAACVFDHGWPILSLTSDSASVTNAGRESILPGGGRAAA